MENKLFSKENFITARDIIPTAIFFVFLILARLVIEAVSAIHPFIYVSASITCGILAMPIFMLWMLKVQKIGTCTINCTLVGLVYALAGGTWLCPIIWLPVGIIMDIERAILNGNQKLRDSFAYALYILGGTLACFVPILVFGDAFFADMIAMGMDTAYLDILRSLISIPTFIIYSIISVVVGFALGMLGSIIFKKKFEKAGLVNEDEDEEDEEKSITN